MTTSADSAPTNSASQTKKKPLVQLPNANGEACLQLVTPSVQLSAHLIDAWLTQQHKCASINHSNHKIIALEELQLTARVKTCACSTQQQMNAE